jgi:signal transduction histidine kinase
MGLPLLKIDMAFKFKNYKNQSTLYASVGNVNFVRIYFIAGLLILCLGFMIYTNWLAKQLERESITSSRMLTLEAKLAAGLASIKDRETSNTIKELIQEFDFPFVITDENLKPLVARRIDPSLERRIESEETLQAEDKIKFKRILSRMNSEHPPIPMKFVEGEGRRIVAYFYYGNVNQIAGGSEVQRLPFVIATYPEDTPVFWQNIGLKGSEGELKKSEVLKNFIEEAKKSDRALAVQHHPQPRLGYFHYGSFSSLLKQLKIMPFVQMSLFVAFLVVGLLVYKKMKHNEQAAIWAGLAKETAHQLGTPISSLMGWLEVLEVKHEDKETQKADQEDREDKGDRISLIYDEMRGDLERLRRITSRFGEIGALPKREPLDVSLVIHNAIIYLQKRFPNRSKQVEIIERYSEVPPIVANEELIQWVVENLIKNSLDAIDRERGEIGLSTDYDAKKQEVIIRCYDNGRGILKKDRRKIFIPGHTSKKHGWGLGLTLAKRIVEGYHGGKIRLADSGKWGTEFEIRLPVS